MRRDRGKILGKIPGYEVGCQIQCCQVGELVKIGDCLNLVVLEEQATKFPKVSARRLLTINCRNINHM